MTQVNRKRVFPVRSTRTTKQPNHWVQTADGFVLASDHPIAIEAGTAETRSGSVHESAGRHGIGKRNFA